MSKDIRTKKGLDIKLVGEAALTTKELPIEGVFALKPQDFHGINPKLIAKEGAKVKAGESIFHSKSDDRILFPSPVSGKIIEIIRGAKRKIVSIKIAADGWMVATVCQRAIMITTKQQAIIRHDRP